MYNVHNNTGIYTCEIKRLALGRKCRIGSVYSTENDNFILKNTTNMVVKNYYEPISKSIRISYGKNYADKLKLLGVQSEFELNLMSNNLTERNAFIDFLKDNSDYHLNNRNIIRAIFKCEILRSKEYLEFENNFKYLEPVLENVQLSSENSWYVATDITYGIAIVAVFLFKNIQNLNEEEIIKNFETIKTKLGENDFNFSYLNKAITDNLEIDFFSNLPFKRVKSIRFDTFVNNFKEFVRTGYLEPIEYTLVPLCHFAYLPNQIQISSKQQIDNTAVLIDRLKELKFKLSVFENFDYTIYFDDENNQKIQQMENHLDSIDVNLFKLQQIDYSRYCCSSYLRLINAKRLIEKLLSQMEQMWTDLSFIQIVNNINDIKFYQQLGKVVYLNSISIKNTVNPSILFCYDLNLKTKNPNDWKHCFCEFMYLLREDVNNTHFYVLNFDICKPNEGNSNRILLIKTGQDLIQFKQTINSKVYTDLKQRRPITEKIPRKKEINILLLGETGVGKSTFVNAFYNYSKFDSMDLAEKNGQILSLIEACFNYTDENYNSRKIQVGKIENEVFKEGQSSTQTAKAHRFEDEHFAIQIIDTPGMGDVRGHEIDKKNFEQTIAYISEFDHINAICFLIKPNNVRLSPGLRYCFKELMSHLHKKTIKNLIFCFTNSRGTQYRPGETFPALSAYLKEIEQTSNVKIPFDQKNIFCMDNEAFRYLVLEKSGISCKIDERENYANSWKYSSENSKRMIEAIKALEPLDTKETIILNNIQQWNHTWARLAINLLKEMIQKSNDYNSEKETGCQNAWMKRKNQDLITRLETQIDSLLQKCALMSNSLRMNALGVFNDDFEAYLEEELRNNMDASLFDNKRKFVCSMFTKCIKKFKMLRNKIQGDIKSGTKKEESANVNLKSMFDEILKMQESFKKDF